jgi:hypothetical protein
MVDVAEVHNIWKRLFDPCGELYWIRKLATHELCFAKKWKSMTVETESEDAITGMGDDGHFELRRKGAVVTSVEGTDPAIH